MTKALVLILASIFGAVNSFAAGPMQCNEGYHSEKHGTEYSCVKNSSSSSSNSGYYSSGGHPSSRSQPHSSSSGSSSSSSSSHSNGSSSQQSQTTKGWKDYNAAIWSYNNLMSQYAMSGRNAATAQRQISSANCGSMNCDTSAYQGELNAANEAQGHEQTAIGNALQQCQAAVSEIKAEHSGTPPTCPDGVNGGSQPCPKGTHMALGKCLRN